MMKGHAALTLGLAVTLLGPRFWSQDGEQAVLERASMATSRAIEVMSSIQGRLADAPAEAIALIQKTTEAPILDARARDERLGELRSELGLLQLELDSMLAARTLMAPARNDEGEAAVISLTSHPNASPEVTVGLTDELRRMLDVGRRKPPAPPVRVERHSEPDVQGDSPQQPLTFDGYTADPIGMAKACYRAGRFELGVDVLAEHTSDGQALYWRARCLERLDRLDEAQKDLERLLARPGESKLAERAKTDLEFVRWKKEFVAKLPPGVRRSIP